jgi:hypothetical protein
MSSQAYTINDSVTKRGTLEPFWLQVSRGQVTGHSLVNIFGYFATPATANAYRTAWELGNTTNYAFPSSATTMTLVSTNNSDTATITINGLDANYNIISENLVLNGTNNVTTIKSYFRINNINVSSGSPTNPAGTITLSNGGVTYAQISTTNLGAGTASIGTSQMSLYTVPNGFTLYLTRFDAFSSFNGNNVNFLTYRALTNSSAGVQKIILQQPFDSNYSVTRISPFPYTQGTDVQWQVAPSAAASATVGINIEGILVANDGTIF